MSPRFVFGLVTMLAFAAIAGAIAVAVEVPGSKEFTLVYNVNNAGYVDVCGCKHKQVRQGSLTRRASFLKQLHSTGREICLVDGGSSLFPIKDSVKDTERDEAIRKAGLIVESYNRMGYQAMAVGPFDLAAGMDALRDLEKKAKFPLLSANLVDKTNGELYFKPYVILEPGGVRVGVLGLTLGTLNARRFEKLAPNLKVLDPMETAKKYMQELRGKVDLVVALAHLREESNFKLAEELADLEILVDPYIQYGNHHTWIKEHEWLTFRDSTVFLRSDGQGARLGVVDITVQKPRETIVDSNRGLRA